ncbi:MAG: protein-methionine-sulfoxide reductase heme-binding subunit MsrQ [Chloroflexota bacterium]
MPKFKPTGLRPLVHVMALIPLALLAWDFSQGRLTANPIQEITLRTGRYTLAFLMVTLAVTPLSQVAGMPGLRRLRRLLGIYTFVYASLHLLNFVGLDYGFNPRRLWADIGEKRYALVGFAAFLSLVPLAVTSTRGWVRRLGWRWERLHRLIYLTGVLAVVHFTWQAKAGNLWPLPVGILVLLLLLARFPPISRWLARHAAG